MRSKKPCVLIMQQCVKQRPADTVPLHLRNAPTALMEQLGHGIFRRALHILLMVFVPPPT